MWVMCLKLAHYQDSLTATFRNTKCTLLWQTKHHSEDPGPSVKRPASAISPRDKCKWSMILISDFGRLMLEGGTQGEICHYHHLDLLWGLNIFLLWKRYPMGADTIRHMLYHICDYSETIMKREWSFILLLPTLLRFVVLITVTFAERQKIFSTV